MKKLIVLILLCISLQGFTQYIKGVEIGTIYSNSNKYYNRPNITLLLSEEESPFISMLYQGYVGLELSEYNRPSIITGASFIFGNSMDVINPFVSLQINIFGYNEIIHYFLPNIKVGLVKDRFKVYSTINWVPKQVKVWDYRVDRVVDGILPTTNLTIGINYRL